MCKIEVGEDLRSFNARIAEDNRKLFNEKGIFVLNIMGSPGAGKTTLLENILPSLSSSYRISVIEGDLATQNDAERIKKMGVAAYQINTNGGCHLDAHMIKHEFEKVDAENTDILIIENVGNLVCPISFDLGEALRIVVLSTPEGEDKPQKYPPAMVNTNALVITKTDLAKYVNVSLEKMKKYALNINPKVTILEAGNINGTYCADSVTEYIRKKIESQKNF